MGYIEGVVVNGDLVMYKWIPERKRRFMAVFAFPEFKGIVLRLYNRDNGGWFMYGLLKWLWNIECSGIIFMPHNKKVVRFCCWREDRNGQGN